MSEMKLFKRAIQHGLRAFPYCPFTQVVWTLLALTNAMGHELIDASPSVQVLCWAVVPLPISIIWVLLVIDAWSHRRQFTDECLSARSRKEALFIAQRRIDRAYADLQCASQTVRRHNLAFPGRIDLPLMESALIVSHRLLGDVDTLRKREENSPCPKGPTMFALGVPVTVPSDLAPSPNEASRASLSSQ